MNDRPHGCRQAAAAGVHVIATARPQEEQYVYGMGAAEIVDCEVLVRVRVAGLTSRLGSGVGI